MEVSSRAESLGLGKIKMGKILAGAMAKETIREIVRGVLHKYLDNFLDGSCCDRVVFFACDLKKFPHFRPVLLDCIRKDEWLLDIPERRYHRAEGLFGPVWNSQSIVIKQFPCPSNAGADYREEIIRHFAAFGIPEIDKHVDGWADCMKMSLSAGCDVGMFLGFRSVMLIESRTSHDGQNLLSRSPKQLKHQLEHQFAGGLKEEIMEAIKKHEKTHAAVCQLQLAGPPHP